MELKQIPVLQPIPKERRIYKGIDVFLIWAGGNTCLATIFTGGLIGPSLGLKASLLTIVLASTIGGLFLGLIAVIGFREGLPTMVLTRKAVTTRGSYVASVLNAVQLVGWTSILLYVSAEAMSVVFKSLGFSGPLVSKLFWIIVLGEAEAVYTAIGPEKWVTVQRIAVTTLIIALAYEAYGLVKVFGSRILSGTVAVSLGKYLWGIDMVLATAISWAPLVADYSRFSISSRGSMHGTWWGYSLTSYVLYYLGAAAAALTGAYLGDPTEVIVKLGLAMSAIFLIFIGISAITTNLLNIYSATVSIQNVRPRLNYDLIVYLIGNLSILFAAIPVFVNYFEEFLVYIGITFIPLMTVAILYYLWRPSKPWIGIVSWALGGITGLLTFIFLGYGSTLMSLAVAIAVYCTLIYAKKVRQ
jgi:NCS1 family nucleobase:cation symporter-1